MFTEKVWALKEKEEMAMCNQHLEEAIT